MLQRLMNFYGFRAELLEAGALCQLFPRGQHHPDLDWAAATFRIRSRQQTQDLFALYRLPELDLWVLAFEVDGDWIRTFDRWPNLRDVAASLREAMTGPGTPYIPSGSLQDGQEELEHEVRAWWWQRLQDNLRKPHIVPDDWPQRWADLLTTLD